MSGSTDFLALYQQLGLGPGCRADELKGAYRRRVAELHPDRRGGDPAAAERLQELTAAYNAAMRFHRRHGRLPGAAPARLRAAAAVPRRHDEAIEPARGGLRLAVFGALALAVLGGFVLNGLRGADEPAGPVPQAPPAAARPAALSMDGARDAAAPRLELELGMEAAEVRRIEGRPVMESALRWDYGPSWIAFENGRVSDWYSSKLRPLKAARARPAGDAAR
jgi:hypothetical protein